METLFSNEDANSSEWNIIIKEESEEVDNEYPVDNHTDNGYQNCDRTMSYLSTAVRESILIHTTNYHQEISEIADTAMTPITAPSHTHLDIEEHCTALVDHQVSDILDHNIISYPFNDHDILDYTDSICYYDEDYLTPWYPSYLNIRDGLQTVCDPVWEIWRAGILNSEFNHNVEPEFWCTCKFAPSEGTREVGCQVDDLDLISEKLT